MQRAGASWVTVGLVSVIPLCGWVFVRAASASGATATCYGQPATIVGTDGDDILRGTRGHDVIAGMAGDDVIRGDGTGMT